MSLKDNPRFTSIGHVLFTWKPLLACSPAAKWLWLSCYASAEAKRCLPGLFPGREYAMAEASGMDLDQVKGALSELVAAGLVVYDHENRLLRYLDLPDSHDRAHTLPALKGWWNKFRGLPICTQRNAHVTLLRKMLDNGEANDKMREFWNESFGKVDIPDNPLLPSSNPYDTGTATQPSLFASENSTYERVPEINSLEPSMDGVPHPLPHPTVDPQDQDQDRVQDQDQVQVLCSDSDPDPGSAPTPRSPPPPPPPSNVIPFVLPPPLDERDRLRVQLVSEIGYDHAMRFARIRTEIGSTAFGPHVNDTHEELRTLVRSFSSLDDARPRLLHALAVREAEALHKNTMIYFGGMMWKRSNFDYACAREVKDVDGSRDLPGKGSTGREATGVSAIMEYLADNDDEEKAGHA